MTTATNSCRRLCKAEQVSRKKRKVDFSALLPDDLLLDILEKLPTDILRYKTRYVCKRWFDLTTNRILLDHASLILENTTGSQTVRLVDIREEKDGLKMKDQCLDIPYNGRIKSWCNEFLLITDLNRDGSLFLFNRITKEGSFLPPCSLSCRGHYGCKCGVGLSYDDFKEVYKVVHVFNGPPIQCELLILKSDNISCASIKWKKVNGPSYTGNRQYYWDDPISVQGRYFHWDVHCCKYLISMDTAKERFRQTCLPGSDGIPMNNCYFLVEIGGFLSLLHKVSSDKINVWMLKDYQRTKWEKLQSISISSYTSIYPGSALLPVTSVKSKRYIIFRKPGSYTGLYSYDLKDKLIKRLNINIAPYERCVVQSTAGSYLVNTV
nr:F-box protein At5g49610-like isoform X2 [Erigeron canadensis]